MLGETVESHLQTCERPHVASSASRVQLRSLHWLFSHWHRLSPPHAALDEYEHTL